MRARPPPCDTASIAAALEASAEFGRVRSLRDSYAAASPEVVAAILDQAGAFAQTWLVGLNDHADEVGCRVVDGRVRTAPGHRAAWDAYRAGGWSLMGHPEALGGQALPLALCMAVQEIFDAACPAFGMLAVPSRAAAALIGAYGPPAVKAEWLPRWVQGEWGATICISEAEAGSDVGRIRTMATPLPDGRWQISGEKSWISFGDHDLTPRIGHCLLARTPGAAPGGAGLSLFLVADCHADGTGNGVTVRRIERKMGLHGSPTCVLGFDRAAGTMIGDEGRGLAQMFVMITSMRLSVGAQGLGIASAAADTARAYAWERRQGGPVEAPVAIAEHPDIARQLRRAAAQVVTTRGLLYTTANYAEIAAHDPDPQARADARALTQWLLPIIKTTGGEVGFEVANCAMQVLGGAGYTREWPLEQAARDARVLTIYEGTTGIQALDLVRRRLLAPGAAGLEIFLRVARPTARGSGRFGRCLDELERSAATLCRAGPEAAEAGATGFLHLAALAATGWIAARMGESEAGRDWLSDIDRRAAVLAA